MGAFRVSRLRLLALTTATAVIASLAISTSAAQADTAPPDPGTPITVAGDSLPTVQINGVVWTQLIVGNRVYVGGEFTRARPAGSAVGVNEVVRNNLLAYDLTTGVLIPSFNPNVNGAVRALVASPDGSRIYAGGAFTTVGTTSRSRLAAFSATDGSLVTSWAAGVNSRVNALAITSDTLYVGGAFSAAGATSRIRLAAFATSNGALKPWTGTVQGGGVNALVASPDGSKVIVGGSFTSYNGGSDPGYGMAATDSVTGASLPWKVNSLIRNGGPESAILSLTGSSTGVFGTGYHFGQGGNLEGTFRANWDDGEMVWLEDCHGDTYSAVPVKDVVYTTGHAHYCGNIGGFQQSEPWSFYRTLAFSMDVGGTITADPHGYYNFAGNPRPNLLTFYPHINSGSYTGQGQGPWHVTANENYVIYGGEFTIVNNKGQHGLARFAAKTIAPNKEGPRVKGTFFEAKDFVPSVASFVAGSARLSWRSAYDRDNENLTYEVLRDGVVVKTLDGRSTDWNRPNMSWTDTGLTPGKSYSYRLRVSDPLKNVRTGDAVSVTVAAEGSLSDYAEEVLADSPRSYWPLGETGGAIAFDWASGNDATTGAGVARNAPGAVIGDSSTASTFDGTSAGVAATTVPEPGRDTFTVEAWVKTTSTAGGKIVGFGNSSTGNSTGYDRHVYMDGDGRIWFGVYPGGVATLNTAGSYNDGEWHQIVASLGSTGMSLSIDGKRVAQRGDITSAQPYEGYWRIGGDNLGGWPNQPASLYIAAQIDEVAVYDTVLSRQQVSDHYAASGRTATVPSAPADAYGKAVYGAQPDLYWRLGESSGTAAADSSATQNAGTYFGSVTQGATGLIEGTSNTAADFNGGTVASDTQFSDPRTYSVEAWFQTTTTQGGKIIGFGNYRDRFSDNYDRHVYMQDDGRLVFGTWTGQTNTITSAAPYNDGKRHHVVAMQSSAGMKLYVDGTLVGTNPQTAAQSYSGYWKIGGDPTWGSSSYHFAGRIDEAAVYSDALSATVVANHYSLGTGGTTPEPNAAPTAAFEATADQLSVAVDGSSSTDSDGTVTGWAWNFGDGNTGTGATTSHSYAAAGTYTVTLTVTDNDGATNTTSKSVTVAAAPVNVAPTASFTATTSELTVSVNGAGSADSDGSITQYAWNFGDGATGDGVTATHAYAAAGTYTVTLTVTDNAGATGTTTRSVDVTATVPDGPLAVDTFERTVSGGLGQADTGGTWAVSGGSSNFSVSGGAGRLRAAAAGSTVGATLGSVASTDTEVQVSASLQQAASGSGAYVSVLARKVGTEDYQARVKVGSTGVVQLQLMRKGTTLAALNVAGLTYATGETLQIRVQAYGTSPTTIRAKVWKKGAPEPANWQLTATDATLNMQQAGSIGLGLYLAGTATVAPLTVAFDDLWAGKTPAGG